MRTLPHVPTFQNAYKSYRVSFLGESRNAPVSPVRAKFRCRVGVQQYTIKRYINASSIHSNKRIHLLKVIKKNTEI